MNTAPRTLEVPHALGNGTSKAPPSALAGTKLTPLLRRAASRWAVVLLALAWLVCSACASDPRPGPSSPETASAQLPASRGDQPSLGEPETRTPQSESRSPTQPAPTPARTISWLEDDAAGALARAKREGKLLLIDVWAEWCHTCLSMQSYVMNDPSLAEFEASFVFLELDSDAPENAEFLQRFAIDVWPTYLVLAPETDEVVGYWPGAGSLEEMRAFLSDSRDAAELLRTGSQRDPLLAAFIEAKRAQGEGRREAAVRQFAAAYRAMPNDWPRRSELLLGYIRTLVMLERFDDCAALGERHMRELQGAAIPIQFAQRTFLCLGQTKTPKRKQRVEGVLQHMRSLAYSQDSSMSFDDRADALDILASSLAAVGDEAAARKVALDRLQLIEGAARAAQSPEQARTFDQARSLAYVAAGRANDAIALLTQREKEFPTTASAPAQLSQVYIAIGRYPEARAALERAIARAEGQRKATLLGRLEKLGERLGDLALTTSATEQRIAVLRTLPGALAKRDLARAEARLEQLRAQPSPP